MRQLLQVLVIFLALAFPFATYANAQGDSKAPEANPNDKPAEKSASAKKDADKVPADKSSDMKDLRNTKSGIKAPQKAVMKDDKIRPTTGDDTSSSQDNKAPAAPRGDTGDSKDDKPPAK